MGGVMSEYESYSAVVSDGHVSVSSLIKSCVKQTRTSVDDRTNAAAYPPDHITKRRWGPFGQMGNCPTIDLMLRPG